MDSPGEGLESRVARLAAPILEQAGLELVLVEYTTRGGQRLRFVIDKPGGVSLDDCAEASRRLGAALDVEDPIAGRYDLDVSSPGLDRPLIRPEDYDRFAGRRAFVKTASPLAGRRVFRGRIVSRSGDRVILDLADGSGRAEIPLSAVLKARLEVEETFGTPPRRGGRAGRRKGGVGRR